MIWSSSTVTLTTTAPVTFTRFRKGRLAYAPQATSMTRFRNQFLNSVTHHSTSSAASCIFGPHRFVGESSETPAARSQQDIVLRPNPSSIPGMIVKNHFRLLQSRTLVRLSHHSAIIAGSVHAAIGVLLRCENCSW
jgi:hypothetical protein